MLKGFHATPPLTQSDPESLDDRTSSIAISTPLSKYVTMPKACARKTAMVTLALAVGGHHVRGWTNFIIRTTQDPVSRCMSYPCRVTSTFRKSSTRLVPTCKLEKLPRRTLQRVVPLRPTLERWMAHYGQTSAERQRRLVNGLGTAFVLYWVAFFASRTLMGWFTWQVSSALVLLQAFLWPLIESYRHVLEIWGDGGKPARRKTRGALFTGRVTRTGFALASEASNHRTHFQMLVEDEAGRELFFDVPQVSGYRNVRRGMQCEVVVLSRSPGFSKLTGVTDAYIPELDIFVGRYPLLNKSAFWKLINARNDRGKHESSAADSSTARQRQGKLSTKPARNRPLSVAYTRDEYFRERAPVYRYTDKEMWKSSGDSLISERGCDYDEIVA